MKVEGEVQISQMPLPHPCRAPHYPPPTRGTWATTDEPQGGVFIAKVLGLLAFSLGGVDSMVWTNVG